MEQQTQGTPPAAPQKKSKVWLWVIGGCLAIIILIGVMVLALGWWGIKKVKNEWKDVSTVETVDKIKDAAKESLTELISKGMGVKCSVISPEDGTTVTVSAKGKNVKIEGFGFKPSSDPSKEDKGTMLTAGGWVYIWSGKEGMKFNVEEMDKLNAENGTENNQSLSEQMSWENWSKEMEKSETNYKCDPAVLTDGDFAVPKDVTFVDWGESLKQLQNLQNNTPQIPAVPGQ